MITKIFIPFLLFAICRAKPQFQLSQKQAQQVASQLKRCVPVTPLAPGINYMDSLHNTWNVVRVYDAPMQYAIPPLVFEKESDGNTSISGPVPGVGNLKVPSVAPHHGCLNILHNLTISLLGTPTPISLNVRLTILDFELPNFLLHGCGKVVGPEFQMAIVLSQQTTLDAAYAAKVAPMLQTYGISTN